MIMATATEPRVELVTDTVDDMTLRSWYELVEGHGCHAFHSQPRWLSALAAGLQFRPYTVLARRDDQLSGVLPLAFVKSTLFGRFLVSLPYVNTAGIVSDLESVRGLVDRAVKLADKLDVRYLELRHEREFSHPALTECLTHKVHMRLSLPDAVETLWTSLKPKVRNQIRKGERNELTVKWAHKELLNDFYRVFSRNMRDLGTPVFGRTLFQAILDRFKYDTELCVVYAGGRPIASALLVHGAGLTEVPSASSLREYNSMNANMLMYWHLLKRAISRGQQQFDFGRSTKDSNTFRFKKQWGAEPHPAVWQYYVRSGSPSDMQRDNRKYSLMTRAWSHLPLTVANVLGPRIVRGIP